MNQIIFMKFISREEIRPNRTKLYVFGDNDCRTGYGGQAKEMRGEPNSIGIRVKKKPSNEPNAYYTDKEFHSNAKKIEEDFKGLDFYLRCGKIVVFPFDGIGTGLAKLNEYAPNTLRYLNSRIKILKRFYNEI